MKTILTIIKKEMFQFRRDPKMLAITFVAPVLQLLVLGFAANLDVDNVKLIMLDYDKSSLSRELTEKFTGCNNFELVSQAQDYNDVVEHIDKGKALLAVVIPRGFETAIESRRTAPLQVILNASDGNTASIAGGYAAGVIGGFSKNIAAEYLDKSGIKIKPFGSITAVPRIWYNPYVKTRYFMVPAIVGLILSIVTLLLTSLAIVKEKEIGTFEQLIVTPIKPLQLILGKLLPFVLFAFISAIIVLTGMRFIFDIPVRGSIIFLFVSSFLYVLSTLGLGLFISTVSRTQQQAMLIAVFAVMMPMVFLSGFAFPLENMPDIIRAISVIIPLKYFLIILRGIILKGLGMAELWKESLILLVMGVSILLLSSMRFRKRLE